MSEILRNLADILLRKLDSVLNPKFQNRFILSLFFVGTSLMGYNSFLSVLSKLEIITNIFSIQLQLSEADDKVFYWGVFFVIMSVCLFMYERFIGKSEMLLFRYYICEDYEQLVEISQGNLALFPVDNPLIIKNQVLESLNVLIKAHPYSYRHANAWGESFNSKEEYLKKYPLSLLANKSSGEYSYFQFHRIPSITELKKFSKEDGMVKLMLEDGQAAESISHVGCYEDACGGVAVQEEYIFRKLWCVFLAVKNITNKPISLINAKCELDIESGFHVPVEQHGSKLSIDLPQAPLSPNDTALIPVMILLPPLYPLERKQYSSATTHDWKERSQIVKHENITTNNLKDFLLFGNRMDIYSVSYSIDRQNYIQKTYTFNPTSTYTIDRHWQCGSCPHMFLEGIDLRYERELLAHCEGVRGSDFFAVPNDVTNIIIAEIEDETTEIDVIKINKQECISNIRLAKTDFIRIPVHSGDIVEITGRYIPDKILNTKELHGVKRNELISKFIKEYRADNA